MCALVFPIYYWPRPPNYMQNMTPHPSYTILTHTHSKMCMTFYFKSEPYFLLKTWLSFNNNYLYFFFNLSKRLIYCHIYDFVIILQMNLNTSSLSYQKEFYCLFFIIKKMFAKTFRYSEYF